jgi:hypothetical protein
VPEGIHAADPASVSEEESQKDHSSHEDCHDQGKRPEGKQRNLACEADHLKNTEIYKIADPYPMAQRIIILPADLHDNRSQAQEDQHLDHERSCGQQQYLHSTDLLLAYQDALQNIDDERISPERSALRADQVCYPYL